MHLASIHVDRFRNLRSLAIEPAEGLNLIVGENGQGKTNFLEAIYFALLGRSFRTRREEECLPWMELKASEGEAGSEEGLSTVLRASLVRKTGQRNLRLVLGASHKSAFADDVLVPRLADLWSQSAIVTFSPSDVDLFRDAPARRRRFLDQLLCQISARYLQSLGRYNEALRQLNAILKNDRGSGQSESSAHAFYPILAREGAVLVVERRRAVDSLAEQGRSIFKNLGGVQELGLKYVPGEKAAIETGLEEEALAQSFEQNWKQSHADYARQGMLRSGPHRDDMRATLDERDLGRFGSQGQHRLVALALKLGAAEFMEQGQGDPPILLLDDFGSELDAARRASVLSNLRGRMQTFITATDQDDLGAAEDFDLVKKISGGAWD